MSIEEICRHERCNMAIRHTLGYGQHDNHVWRWLNYHLRLWGEAHPFRFFEVNQ